LAKASPIPEEAPMIIAFFESKLEAQVEQLALKWTTSFTWCWAFQGIDVA
jgi:hypothetical protein